MRLVTDYKELKIHQTGEICVISGWNTVSMPYQYYSIRTN